MSNIKFCPCDFIQESEYKRKVLGAKPKVMTTKKAGEECQLILDDCWNSLCYLLLLIDQNLIRFSVLQDKHKIIEYHS